MKCAVSEIIVVIIAIIDLFQRCLLLINSISGDQSCLNKLET